MNSNNNTNKKGIRISSGGKFLYSNEFRAWFIEHMQKLTRNAVGDRTFAQYLVEVKIDAEIRDIIFQNLGTSDEIRPFSRLDFGATGLRTPKSHG